LHRINFFLKKGESTEHLKREYQTPNEPNMNQTRTKQEPF